MAMTEEEAKSKACFKAATFAGSQQIADGPGPNCIASACMAWRFIAREHRRETELWSKSRNQRVNSAYGDDADWRPVNGNKDDEPPPAVGCCGLLAHQ